MDSNVWKLKFVDNKGFKFEQLVNSFMGDPFIHFIERSGYGYSGENPNPLESKDKYVNFKLYHVDTKDKVAEYRQVE